ncbi:terpenoid synthase [Fomitiporia mediterranea MF3/22]|uniref:terpenoid synthase n=1 Tax=Fomitiporia mediterranea (strain MF3/22) TaxID=694068 RepID=UPI0004409659|nr:terpenoid synthase [Fomitiporia mediterranea MF3/22]EJD00099.1 terpenoid synthase [Fomitiporia mediterranea MF3/22]
MSCTSTTLFLPELLANWPWPREINPHYEEVKKEADAWFRSFNAFSTRSQLAFDKCDFALLASLAYPRVSKEHLRTGCDLMILLFAIDEYTDMEHEIAVREIIDIVIDAINNPHKARPADELVLGEIARQFWTLAIKTATRTSQCHMIEGLVANLEAVVQQAADRDNDEYYSIASYLEFRRENIGAKPAFVPMELHLDLPDEVFYHPVITELSQYVTDMVILDNDMNSYNKEQATGDDHANIVTVVMHELHTGLDDAMEWILKYHRELETKFLDGLKRVPSWSSEIDLHVQQYVHGLANWPRGNDCWCFESGRYFGSKGLEVQRTRRVPLLPKICQTSIETPGRESIVVPLIDSMEVRA